MKFRGNYYSGESYDVGDVVIFSDSEDTVYSLQRPCPVSTPPTNSLYWGRVGQPMSQLVLFLRDALVIANDNAAIVASDAAQQVVGSYFFDDKTLILASSSEGSDKRYAITVEDGESGGELVVDEIVEESADDNEGGDT